MRKSRLFPSQSGVTLVEVLVAIVIFAFGLLGAAGLQLSTLRSNQFATASATATSLARDYAEVMQLYPSAVAASAGSSTFFIDTSTVGTTTLASACNTTAATCTTTTFVASLQTDWAQRVQAALPAGRAKVCRDSQPRDATTGLMSWACDGTGDIVVVKVGWLAKADKGEAALSNALPKLSIPVMGNLADFVSP